MSDERGVIYCKSVDSCREMAETFDCRYHHSQMSKAERRDVIACWVSGQGFRLLLVTTGFGTGIDIGGIVIIIHNGIPYGLVDHIQQTGRGARRDGQFVRCITMHSGKQPYEGKGISSVEPTRNVDSGYSARVHTRINCDDHGRHYAGELCRRTGCCAVLPLRAIV